MNRLSLCLLLCLSATGGPASAAPSAAPKINQARSEAPAKAPAPDSKQMEKDLQRLPWQQFRSIIESVPKLKAGVDAYGPAGWQFVQANYKNYAWKRNIDKLDEPQKRQLAELIQKARNPR